MGVKRFLENVKFCRIYLSDPHRHREGSQLLVKRDQHTWLHGCYQPIKNVVRFAQDYCNAQNEHQGDSVTGHVKVKSVELAEGRKTHCS